MKIISSPAIMCYLVDQYAKDDKFYPKAAKERAIVNQRLYFELGTLHTSILACYVGNNFNIFTPLNYKRESR